MSRTVSGIAAFILAWSAVTTDISAADTDSVDSLVKQAQKAMVDGKYKVAMTALEKAIEAAPDRADLYGMRAKVHDERGDLDKALADAKKMIELTPDDARGYIVRAAIYRRNEKYDEALVDANAAIEKSPKSADAYYTRSDVYNDMGKDALAKADEAKANSLDH